MKRSMVFGVIGLILLLGLGGYFGNADRECERNLAGVAGSLTVHKVTMVP